MRLMQEHGTNPSLGLLFHECEGLLSVKKSSEGLFKVGAFGVERILTTSDGKVDFICREDGKVFAYVDSATGFPAIYPLHPARIKKPVKAILMNLDGTTVHSDQFWAWIIEQTTAKLLSKPAFALEEKDIHYLSVHKPPEQLAYAIERFCPGVTIVEAEETCQEITNRELQAILNGHGRYDTLIPAEGLKEFLRILKERNIMTALVSSESYQKAWPLITATFKQLNMGDPRDYYDAIISAGYSTKNTQVGTLGHLESLPHPWLYAETARVGLGIEFSEHHRVVGIDCCGTGVVACRLAGFTSIGFRGGDIKQSGTLGLCSFFCDNFDEVLEILE